MRTALLCIDFTNDLVSKDGKLANLGFAEQVEKNNTLETVHRIQEHFREQGRLIVHMRSGFSSNYHEYPAKGSPMFGDIKGAEALIEGSKGFEFAEQVAPKEGEVKITKHRVSAFNRTRLDIVLRANKIEKLYIVGVGSDWSVDSTAWEAHDLDYDVHVVSDACVAEDESTNEVALKAISKIADVHTFAEMAVKLATTEDTDN